MGQDANKRQQNQNSADHLWPQVGCSSMANPKLLLSPMTLDNWFLLVHCFWDQKYSRENSYTDLTRNNHSSAGRHPWPAGCPASPGPAPGLFPAQLGKDPTRALSHSGPPPALHSITQLGLPPGHATAWVTHCSQSWFPRVSPRQPETIKGTILNSAGWSNL